MVVSKRLLNPKSLSTEELFKQATSDAEHEVSPGNVHEARLTYNEYGEISYRALVAMAELHRRGNWLIQEIQIERDVSHVGRWPSRISVETPKVVEIEMRRGL